MYPIASQNLKDDFAATLLQAAAKQQSEHIFTCKSAIGVEAICHLATVHGLKYCKVPDWVCLQKNIDVKVRTFHVKVYGWESKTSKPIFPKNKLITEGEKL